MHVHRAALAGAGALAIAAIAPDAIAQPVASQGGIRFSYSSGTAESVSVAGAFNDWSATANPMERNGDVWTTVVPLEPGEHEYKFVVDGTWVADPDNPVTAGEYGNSIVTVGTTGENRAMAATSNTPHSPKVYITGRTIGLYVARANELRGDRYELQRPVIDVDLNFGVRVNSDLSARILANIQNDRDGVEFHQTRLNFDRGSLTLDNAAIYAKAWDNEGAIRFDDPLTLVGDVGIYDHAYGYETVGALARKSLHGFDVEVFYADDSEAGGNDGPEVSPAVIRDGAGNARFPESRYDVYTALDTDANKDVLAARVRRTIGMVIGGRWTAALQGRLDRGYNPGTRYFFEPIDEVTGVETSFDAVEGWYAVGGDLRYEVLGGLSASVEYLRAETELDAFNGRRRRCTINRTQNDALECDEIGTVGDRSEDLGSSDRAHLGIAWPGGPGDVDAHAAFAWHRQELLELATGDSLANENEMSTVTFGLARRWERAEKTGSRARASFDLEFNTFTYDANALWDAQFWFDVRNHWLEHGEHEVAFERLTLLGGHDAAIWRPEVGVTIWDRYDVEIAYRGTLASTGLAKEPKYFESLFQLTSNLNRRWRATIDTRLARYDDPVLGLDDTFSSIFAEVAYIPAEGINLAFSFGVDPYAIDEPVNEYAYIGRDLFLFERGANAALALSDYGGLAEMIPAAERALEEERRVQVEAIVHF